MIDFGIDAITATAVLLVSFYIFFKATKYKPPIIYKFLALLWCLLWAALYAIVSFWVPPLLFRVLLCASSIGFIFMITKIKPDIVISAFLISFGTSYFLYYIALAVLALVFIPFANSEYIYGVPTDFNKPIYLLLYFLTFALHLFLSYLLFRIRRFKNGFPFLFKGYAVIVALIVAGTVLSIVTGIRIFYEAYDFSYYPLFFLGLFVVGVGIFIWIRRGIKLAYRRWTKEHNDDLHKQEIAKKDHEIQRLKEMHETVRAANHIINHRLAAWERNLAALSGEMQKYLPIEISEELTVTLEDIRRLSQEYTNKVNRVKRDKPLPSTNIQMIDNMFEHYLIQFISSKIDFNLKVNGSITHMVENVIAQGKLETLIGDHLQDALIAVDLSDNPIRNVLAIIGAVGGCYEFKVYDSGIPFEADTLVRLGTERVTTHDSTGGSGVGFMTTFDTMRECGASLIISEQKPNSSTYSKSVTIRFDGKNQYIIKTYRQKDFPKSGNYFIVAQDD